MISVSGRTGAGRPRILVLRALGLGDLLTGVPALRGLRGAFPQHELVLATPASLIPLIRLVDGVDTVVDVDFRDRVGDLPPQLRGPDVAVNLHGRGPQSHAALLALDPGQLVAFRDTDGTHEGPPWDDDEHERVRWCRLLTSAGMRADPDDYLLAPPADCVPSEFAGATIIHPGASAPARRWPVDRWAAVARHELDHGREVIITGDATEVELAKAVAARSDVGGQWVVAGHTDVEELASLVCAADRVVCGDTGIAHLATAFATPSVVLFGPTPPAHWGPPDNGRHIALWTGRTADPHAGRPDRGLLEITVGDVTGALDALATSRS